MDLLLKSNAIDQPIEVVLVGSGIPKTFLVPWPAEAIKQLQAWRRRYLAHNDPAAANVSADAVNMRGHALVTSLQNWFADPAWRPLDQQRQLNAAIKPLRISFEGACADLQALPWELLHWDQPIWRTEQQQHLIQRRQRSPHQPNLLVWIGQEDGLSLNNELQALKELERGGQIRLQVRRGNDACLAELKTALEDQGPWDALIFLGHSEADHNSGGRIQLADGSWITAPELQSSIETAVEKGLELVLLNSCSGLDLAKSLVRFGVSWAVCFREPVTCQAASAAFQRLLKELAANQNLIAATHAVRQWLRSHGPPGSSLLLTVLGISNAEPYKLPLSKKRQFALRLRTTSRWQWIAAGTFFLIGCAVDVVPNNSMSRYGLDRRLYVQRLWRQATNQPGPSAQAIPVFVIDKTTDQRLEAETQPNRVSHQTLARLLQAASPEAIPQVALDVVLDEIAPQSGELVEVLKTQRRSKTFAGYFGDSVEAPGAGSISEPHPQLKAVGLQWFNLSTGMIANQQRWQPAPLFLVEPITPANFAAQLSRFPERVIPADAVIDWSLDWGSLIQRIELEQLPLLKSPILLVGTDGTTNSEHKDLFITPGALKPELSALWKGSRTKMPGVMVQAVLAQSINLNHWLTSFSSAVSTMLTAALGIALSALIASRSKRLWLCVAISAVAVLFGLQLTISMLWLLPLLLPICTLFVISSIRED